jgi:selenoprotein W-related protein
LPEAARLRLAAAFAEFRVANRDLADREVIREIRALLAGEVLPTTPAATRAPAAPATPAAPAPQAPSRIEELRRRAAEAPRAARPLKVSITYCAACGYEPQTLELTAALMHAFTHDLSAIELIPWQDGAFDVVVDGELVHSMYRDGGFPASAAIIAAVRERITERTEYS